MQSARRSLIEVPHVPERGLGAFTWEQRRKMTAAELIKAMGPLHVNHPHYKGRPGTLLPMPNLVHRNPEFEIQDTTFWGLCKAFVRWAAQ